MRSALFVFVALTPLVAGQAQPWTQCGGQGWNGATTCVSGWVCTYSNPWYSQCLQATSTSTSTTSTTTTTDTTTTTTSSSTSSTSSTSTSTTSTTTGGTTPTSCPTLPASVSYSNSKLPDPFKFVSTGNRAATKADFACRQQEINNLFQKYEMGTLPPKPANVSGSLSGNTLTIRVTENGKSVSWTVTLKPATSGSGPYPAIISLYGPTIPVPSTVTLISLNTDDIAHQDSGTARGIGNFYTIYGQSHSAGSLLAWAWGVGRIIDVLEQLGSSATNIDTTRIGVSGCSRWGKGAFIVGAFEPRIALTIPQESGSGGAACWRLSDWQQQQGQNVQTLGEIIGENVWYSTALNAFSGKTSTLSVDHHLLAALVAPRGLYVIENTSMEWLGAQSTNGCMRTGRKVYEALGVTDSMGYSQVGGHDHCNFPSSQNAELTAFINRFLLKQSASTNILKTDGSYTFNESQWIDWTTPTLT